MQLCPKLQCACSHAGGWAPVTYGAGSLRTLTAPQEFFSPACLVLAIWVRLPATPMPIDRSHFSATPLPLPPELLVFGREPILRAETELHSPHSRPWYSATLLVVCWLVYDMLLPPLLTPPCTAPLSPRLLQSHPHPSCLWIRRQRTSPPAFPRSILGCQRSKPYRLSHRGSTASRAVWPEVRQLCVSCCIFCTTLFSPLCIWNFNEVSSHGPSIATYELRHACMFCSPAITCAFHTSLTIV